MNTLLLFLWSVVNVVLLFIVLWKWVAVRVCFHHSSFSADRRFIVEDTKPTESSGILPQSCPTRHL